MLDDFQGILLASDWPTIWPTGVSFLNLSTLFYHYLKLPLCHLKSLSATFSQTLTYSFLAYSFQPFYFSLLLLRSDWSKREEGINDRKYGDREGNNDKIQSPLKKGRIIWRICDKLQRVTLILCWPGKNVHLMEVGFTMDNNSSQRTWIR